MHTDGQPGKSHGMSIYSENAVVVKVKNRELLNETTGSGILTTVSSPVARNEWHHIAMTREPSGGTTLYIDACMRDSATPLAAPASNNATYDTVKLGKKNHPTDRRFFNGSIDELMIFYAVKNPQQIASLYRGAV